MEEIVGKPIDLSASGAVANSPLRQTIRPIRQRILGQGSQYPLLKNALVSKPILHPVSSIEAGLAKDEEKMESSLALRSENKAQRSAANRVHQIERWPQRMCKGVYPK
jgi:hypothetical protein